MINIRASSLIELFDCPARWEAKHLLGMQQKGSGAALLGTAIHASTAAFDGARLRGDPLTVDEAAGALVDILHKTEDVDWEESSPEKAEKIALPLHRLYCETVKLEFTAVEMLCEGLEIPDLGISLSGTVDRVIKNGDGSFSIGDLKSGKTAVTADGRVDVKKHKPQIAVYELLAGVTLGHEMKSPAKIIGLKTSGAPAVATGDIIGAREALVGSNGAGMLDHAAAILHNGVFYGNPGSMLCGKKFCPRFETCKFRG